MSTTVAMQPGTIFRVTTHPAGIGPHYTSRNNEDAARTREVAGRMCKAITGSTRWATTSNSSDTLVFTGTLGDEVYALLDLFNTRNDSQTYEHLMAQLSKRASFEILA